MMLQKNVLNHSEVNQKINLHLFEGAPQDPYSMAVTQVV